MKTIKGFLIYILSICVLIACTKTDQPFLVDDSVGVTLKKGMNTPVLVNVPFKTDLSVWDMSDYADTRCGGYPVFFLTMEGYGTATHLGKLTTIMTFCCDVTTGAYYNTAGTFVAANGDELFFEIPNGQIIPNDEDNSSYYQTKFDDLMIFTGGTGRFAGATGEAMSNAYVHDGEDEWRTDFFSKGTLTLVKGK